MPKSRWGPDDRRAETVVRLHLKPGLGTYRIAQLSVQDVQRFLDRLYDDGYSAASIHQIRKVLSAALTYAVRQELLFRNVARSFGFSVCTAASSK